MVDDMALCRLVKDSGRRVVFADGDPDGRLPDVPRRRFPVAWIADFYEGIGGHPVALVAVMALHLWLFVAPYIALPIAALLGDPGLAVAAAIGVVANLLLRLVMACRYRHGMLSVLLHPVAVLAMMGILLDSYRWSRRGDIRGGGRSYADRSPRVSVSAAPGDADGPVWSRAALARAGDTRRPSFLAVARRYARRRVGRGLDGLWVAGLDEARAACPTDR